MDTQDIDLSKAPLLTHLIELRRRMLHCLLFFLVVLAISCYYSEQIYQFLLDPLEQAFAADNQRSRNMIYTGLHEAFFTYLKLGFFTAAFFTIPPALIQLWRFIAPGLYTSERKPVILLFVMTPILFLLGAALAFYVVMPLAWEFFLGFETQGSDTQIAVQLEAKVSEYLGLVIQLILAFGLSFELPIFLLVLAKSGLITADDLVNHRKHAIVLAFLIAAVLTPPDLISQIALGTPILLLYEVSILLIRWTASDITAVQKRAL